MPRARRSRRSSRPRFPRSGRRHNPPFPLSTRPSLFLRIHSRLASGRRGPFAPRWLCASVLAATAPRSRPCSGFRIRRRRVRRACNKSGEDARSQAAQAGIGLLIFSDPRRERFVTRALGRITWGSRVENFSSPEGVRSAKSYNSCHREIIAAHAARDAHKCSLTRPSMYPFRGASARTCLGVRALLLAVAAGCRRVDAAAIGAPAAAGAARGYWLDRGTNTDGRRGSATYWRDRAAATEKPSRGRDQGRKVSPKRDQSGKPAKRDRRRREAGIFTL